MRILDTFSDALQSMATRGGRTLMTLASIMLGLASLIITSGLSLSAGENVVRNFDQYRATQLVLSASGNGVSALPASGLADIRTLNGVSGVAAICRHGSVPVVSAAGGQEADLDVIEMDAASLALLEPEIHAESGATTSVEALTDRGVAVVGVGVAQRLRLASPARGVSVEAGGLPLSVVGIIDDIPRLPTALNQILVVVSRPGAGPFGACHSWDVVVRTEPGWAASLGGTARGLIMPNRPEIWTVAVPPSPEELRSSVTGDLAILYVALAAISLVVGALAVANTMSIAVFERVSEIGLRRATGFSARRIFALFAAEALILGSLGGIIGAGLGCLAVLAATAALGWPTLVSVGLVLICPPAGAVIGLLGGLVPAQRAASMSPATALRA
jgi:putative ABC transport system permease protein